MSAERAEQIAGDELASKQARAFVLHTKGESYRSIAAQLGISTGTAWNWVAQAAAALEFRPSDESAERARDRAVLDEWLSRLTAEHDRGLVDTVATARTVVQILGRRAAMLGYDAPRKSAITIEPEREKAVPDMALLEELRRATEHAAAMAAMEADDGLFDDEKGSTA
ncbi:sigma factor-like helix-turn-helix DNA-binding protein [Pseudonocardia sp. MH-G8]|uniref:sigma-70 region 4 domain-containing protein n=1 Tax=Pseudonocardia sp. MH-G8 TaxID=1854588 RepID=UPI0013045544|nr:sigma-70 region 4 domain-containing protein [Pseudonocardia sp. MH-G8]